MTKMIATCEGCGKQRVYSSASSSYVLPRFCSVCAFQWRFRPATGRIVSPWIIDEQGNKCRSVEGGA